MNRISSSPTFRRLEIIYSMDFYLLNSLDDLRMRDRPRRGSCTDSAKGIERSEQRHCDVNGLTSDINSRREFLGNCCLTPRSFPRHFHFFRSTISRLRRSEIKAGTNECIHVVTIPLPSFRVSRETVKDSMLIDVYIRAYSLLDIRNGDKNKFEESIGRKNVKDSYCNSQLILNALKIDVKIICN